MQVQAGPRFADVTVAQHSIPDYVMREIVALMVLTSLWFAVKALARRGHLVGLFRRLDPYVQAMTRWAWGAPAVFTYVATWTVTSVLQQGVPEQLTSMAARWQSTNIFGLSTQPVRVLFSSAFIVADNGTAFALYVIIYVLFTARLEHRIGAARIVFVGACAHVLGSLLTVAVEIWAIHVGLAPKTMKYAQDVGVSYVMVGSLGAYLWVVSRRWRPWFALALAAGVVLPMVLSRTVWDLGHFLATTIGFLAGWVALKFPQRQPLLWRSLTRSLAARDLPTFPLQPRPWPDGYAIPPVPAARAGTTSEGSG